MDKELSFYDIDVDDVADDIIPVGRVMKIIDENEFFKEDDEETEITLNSLGLD